MKTVAILSLSSALLLLNGCASYHVQRGALIGALSGAAVGSGVGYAVSSEDLLGSDDSGPGGDTSLPRGGSIAAGLAIGVVTGAIVGAMFGHGNDDGYEERPKPVLDTPETQATPDAEPQARAPYLRGL
jgi:hypothetical protein